jgi:DNA-binding LacI/PurR family transcriptional regulator
MITYSNASLTAIRSMNDERHLLYERLYDHVLDQIRAGLLTSGDRVPSEKELAATFGVSRITSMRALQMLEQAGVIVRIRGKGSFVSRELPSLRKLAPNGEHSPARPTRQAASIGLLIPDASEAYGLGLLNAVEERSAEHGFSLVLRRTRGRQDEEERSIDTFVRSGSVDGLIIFPIHGEYYNASLLRLVLEKYPVVLVDRYLKGIAACAVYTDNVAAARELTGYMLDHGHESLAFVSPFPKNTSSIEDRLHGFRLAFTERGLGPAAQHLLTTLTSTLPDVSAEAHVQADRQAIGAFIESHPTISGFVASEYNVALLVQTVLSELGRKADGTVIACFDSPRSPFVEPRFTHIKQDDREMGFRAVDLLLAQLRGEQVPSKSIVPHSLETPFEPWTPADA